MKTNGDKSNERKEDFRNRHDLRESKALQPHHNRSQPGGEPGPDEREWERMGLPPEARSCWISYHLMLGKHCARSSGQNGNGGFSWKLGLIMALAIMHQVGVMGAEPLKVAFFYNETFFTTDELRQKTEAVLTENETVKVSSFGYKDTHEFCALYKEHIAGGSENWDLILGPSDSDSLKALDRALSTKQEVPFLAPYVTTEPSSYAKVALLPASATDALRVQKAVRHFVRYTALRTVTLVHTDDPWGHGIAKHLRDELLPLSLNLHTLPVIERESREEGFMTQRDNTKHFERFLMASKSEGATVLVIALLYPSSLNELLGVLEQINNDSMIQYKPSILLLQEPSFDESSTHLGLMRKYVEDSRLFYVAENTMSTNRTESSSVLDINHYDACRLIRLSASAWPVLTEGPDDLDPGAHLVRRFYNGTFPDELIASFLPHFEGAFHASKLGGATPVLDVQQIVSEGKKIETRSASHYFGKGFWQQSAYTLWFFMLNHRALWNGWVLAAFTCVSLGSFVYVVGTHSMRPFWILWRLRAFWQLFGVNLLLTYMVWVASVAFGIFEANNIVAALGLAALCPTAGSALDDVMRKYLPLNLTWVFKIIEQLNERLLHRMGDARLKSYKEHLKQFDLSFLKSRFFEVLFLELKNDALRNRIREQLAKQMKQISGQVGSNLDEVERALYADFYVTAVGYLSKDENDFWGRLVAAGFGAPASREDRMEEAGTTTSSVEGIELEERAQKL